MPNLDNTKKDISQFTHTAIFAIFLFVAIVSASVLFVVMFAEVERVSIDSFGLEGNGNSDETGVSSDGRYVVFRSASSNLVPNDTNGVADAFVFDSQSGTIERISVDNNGVQGNANSGDPKASDDGRFIVFESSANNFIADSDSNGVSDIFLYDMEGNDIERVSVSSEGEEANGASTNPVISSDSRYIVFESTATNLVSDDTNAKSDVFVYDRSDQTTILVSMSSDGVIGNENSGDPAISENGRYVSFESVSTNLVDDDTNAIQDIFVYDIQDGDIERVTVSNDLEEANASSRDSHISDNGRFIAFQSSATNLVPDDTNAKDDIFVYDQTDNIIERVSINEEGVEGNGHSQDASVSEDGRYVTFKSVATNLVSNDTNGKEDVFIYDRENDVVARVTINNDGEEANGDSNYVTFSDNGEKIVFRSSATNLVEDDTNGVADIFLADNPLLEEDEDTGPSIPASRNDTHVRGGGNVSIITGSPITGCRDPQASNYSPNASFPGECRYNSGPEVAQTELILDQVEILLQDFINIQNSSAPVASSPSVPSPEISKTPKIILEIPESRDECMMGDLNNDYSVDMKDMSMLAYWQSHKLTPEMRVIEAYCLNIDGKVDMADFSVLSYYYGDKNE